MAGGTSISATFLYWIFFTPNAAFLWLYNIDLMVLKGRNGFILSIPVSLKELIALLYAVGMAGPSGSEIVFFSLSSLTAISFWAKSG